MQEKGNCPLQAHLKQLEQEEYHYYTSLKNNDDEAQ